LEIITKLKKMKFFFLGEKKFIDKSLFNTILFGSNLVFFPMHFSGLLGMPRRISDYADYY